MPTIYISNTGDDKNDGLAMNAPVKSWQRVLKLCKGNDEMHLMEGEATLMRLKREIDQRDTGGPLGSQVLGEGTVG